MSDKDDIPTIEGVPLASAQRIMLDPAGNSIAADAVKLQVVVETYRPKSIMELINTIPKRTSNPELAQVFMLDALEKFSAAASELNVEDFDASEMGAVVGGEDWKQIGFELSSIIRDHIDYVNGLATTADLPEAANNQRKDKSMEAMEAAGAGVQTQLDEYNKRLTQHDFSGELPQELAEMKARLDPTGEIMTGADPRVTRH